MIRNKKAHVKMERTFSKTMASVVETRLHRLLEGENRVPALLIPKIL